MRRPASSAPTATATGTRVDARAEAARFGAFLLVGGAATVVNVGLVGVLTLLVGWPYIPAALVAIESGMLVSFVLNDRLTFNTLAGNAGAWWIRCLRFHAAIGVGQLLTLAIAASLNRFLGMPGVVAHACGVAIILFFNFATLRLWTYRGRARRGQPSAE